MFVRFGGRKPVPKVLDCPPFDPWPAAAPAGRAPAAHDNGSRTWQAEAMAERGMQQPPAGRRDSLQRAAGPHGAQAARPAPCAVALADTRPATAVQRRQIEAIGNGPRVAAMRAIGEMLNRGPRMASQRKLIEHFENAPRVAALHATGALCSSASVQRAAAVPAPMPAPPVGGAGVVQRSLGFEYELGSVETYAKDGDGGRVRLPKAHLLEARDGFQVTADDPPTGSPPDSLSDLELITHPPIDDRAPANRAVLATTLGAMVAYLRTLRANPLETPVGNDFVGATAATDYDDGTLQATAGLSPGGLAKLTSGRTQAEAGAERQAAEDKKSALAGRKIVWRREAKNRALDAEIAHAAAQEFHAMGVADPALFDSALLQLADMPPGEADLMAAVMSRIIAIPVAARANPNLPYPKAAAGPLMARSDFATVIAHLPAGVMAHFADAAAFKARLLAAIRLALRNNNVNLADPVFSNAVAGAAPLTLTLDAWFDGLYQAGAARVDSLTEANYPGGAAADPERQQLESLGSYGARTDPQAAGATPRPIFEFRSLGTVVAEDLVARGLAVWDMVRRSNEGTEG